MEKGYKILGNYIRLVDERNRNLAITKLLGVSINKKFIPSIANIVGTDLSNYKIVRTGQFAYGPVTSRNGEKISIAYLDEEDCIISSSYTVFEVENKEELDPEYLMLWFSRPEFDRYARYKSHGSVREIFDWNELCMVELPVPDISELDEHIAEFEQKLYTSNKTGNQYKKFDFKFNFAIKELSYVGLISYVKFNPKITLTQDGANVDLTDFDVKTEVRDKARSYWEEHSTKNKSKNKPVETLEVEDEENESTDDELLDDFKVKLQSAIANMSPAKFEQFSRALLTKMGVEFTNKGVQVSNDGGIDGYGYHVDADDFRTTRVVIQCKRFNSNPVSEPDINQFLGAMNKYQADYGVFITNSRFTNKAREAAREGTPITLIDGNDLIRLVIKYELYITPVTTYVLDGFYTED